MSGKKACRLAAEKSVILVSRREKNLEEFKNVCNIPRAADLGLLNAFEASVIFSQEEGGSGSCIDESGIILTCCHVLEDRIGKVKVGRRKYGVFMSGLTFLAEAIALDEKADIAVMKIIKSESSKGVQVLTFPFVALAEEGENKKNQRCYCVGQPFPYDLEGEDGEDGEKMDWELVTTTRGRIKRVMAGDVLDNFEIGKLVHDAWTYWGHSGAPLYDTNGCIIGMHSSWDDETCNRHGVALAALHHFCDRWSELW